MEAIIQVYILIQHLISHWSDVIQAVRCDKDPFWYQKCALSQSSLFCISLIAQLISDLLQNLTKRAVTFRQTTSCTSAVEKHCVSWGTRWVKTITAYMYPSLSWKTSSKKVRSTPHCLFTSREVSLVSHSKAALLMTPCEFTWLILFKTILGLNNHLYEQNTAPHFLPIDHLNLLYLSLFNKIRPNWLN